MDFANILLNEAPCGAFCGTLGRAFCEMPGRMPSGIPSEASSEVLDKSLDKVPANPPSRLPLVVVHHHTPDILATCLQHLHATPLALHIIIVDTSEDKAIQQKVQALATHDEYPQDKDASDVVQVVPCVNHSLAHAVNVGLDIVLQTTTSPVIGQMNADVYVQPESLGQLLKVLELPHVGMVGPMCTTAKGALQQQGMGYWWHYQRLRYQRPFNHIHKNKAQDHQEKGHQEQGYQEQNTRAAVPPHVSVPWLSGCMQLIRRDVIDRVGGMNSSLRFYNEDMEWSFRMRKMGWTCALVDTRTPTSPNHVVHLGGSATPAAVAFTIEGWRGGYRLSQQYQPRAYQNLHRWAMVGWALWQARTARSLDAARAYRNFAEHLRCEAVYESPFGETLSMKK